jgi:hypothetical protein
MKFIQTTDIHPGKTYRSTDYETERFNYFFRKDKESYEIP